MQTVEDLRGVLESAKAEHAKVRKLVRQICVLDWVDDGRVFARVAPGYVRWDSEALLSCAPTSTELFVHETAPPGTSCTAGHGEGGVDVLHALFASL